MAKNFSFPEKLNITLTCASGLEKALKSELKRLGYEEAPINNGAMTISATAEDVARLNLNLRTADRVYIKLKEFTAVTFDELFDAVKEIEWERFIPENARIIVNGKSVKSKLFALSACQSIIKKAIAVRLTNKFNVHSLAESGSEYGVVFWIFKDSVSILLNTSGQGLHKRGYRDLVGIAPIKETLASGLLLLSDFYYKNPLADTFCGSGTIAVEGARIALNVAPGINRKFAFNYWHNFNEKYYKIQYEQARDNEKRDCKPEIFASDIDPKAIKLATRHAERAGVKDVIKFSTKDVKNFSCDLSGGTIVTNPPYGKRVYDKDEARACYKSLRNVYDKLDNWSLYVITSAKDFEKQFGIKADKIRKLYNSNEECKYYYYLK